MNQETLRVIHICILVLQFSMIAYVFWVNPYGWNYLKWKLCRSKTYIITVNRDSDWKEWLTDNIGPCDKHWKVDQDMSSFFLFRHNLQHISLTVKRKYDPYVLQFRLIYEQPRP